MKSTESEIALANAIHVLTESLAASFKIQAETYRVLAQIHPEHAKGLLAAAEGVQVCSSNLLRGLPELPTE